MMSAAVTTPTTWVSLATGRWWMPSSLMVSIASKTSALGVMVRTGLVITSATGLDVSTPAATTRERMSASVMMPATSCPSVMIRLLMPSSPIVRAASAMLTCLSRVTGSRPAKILRSGVRSTSVAPPSRTSSAAARTRREAVWKKRPMSGNCASSSRNASRRSSSRLSALTMSTAPERMT